MTKPQVHQHGFTTTKDEKEHHCEVDKASTEQQFCNSVAITTAMCTILLVLVGLWQVGGWAGKQAGMQSDDFLGFSWR